MERFKRYIAIALLCFLMLAAIVIFTAPTTQADIEDIQAIPIETVRPREIVYKPLRVKTIPIYYEEQETPTERLETENESKESDPINYTALVDIEEYGEAATYLAKTVYGEARGCETIQQAAVIWCVLNRVDAGYGDIISVITAPNQFAGYSAKNPVLEDHYKLSLDVLGRWIAEKNGSEDVGRVLPVEYRYFHGNGKSNIYRDAYKGNYNIWTWDCENPYEVLK